MVAAKVHAVHIMLLDRVQCVIDLSLVVEPVASQNLIASISPEPLHPTPN